MRDLADRVDRVARETLFSGVVRVDIDGETAFAFAYGLAHRGLGVPIGVDSRVAVASVTKGLTALTVASLVEDGALALATTARSVLGRDLPLIDDTVTVEQLLAHRSGIGDYIDEDEMTDVDAPVLTVPVHELVRTEDYLRVLDGRVKKFAPGAQFSYCNSGYVVLALIAERVTGAAFADLVQERVCTPAGMHDTEFVRTDAPGPRCVAGYLDADGLRTNVLLLPALGSGDGGITTTVADLHALWDALFEGRIVSRAMVDELTRPRSRVEVGSERRRYGLGFWLHATNDLVMLEGMDAGASCRTVRAPDGRVTYTVMANTSEGAWPLVRVVRDELDDR